MQRRRSYPPEDVLGPPATVLPDKAAAELDVSGVRPAWSRLIGSDLEREMLDGGAMMYSNRRLFHLSIAATFAAALVALSLIQTRTTVLAERLAISNVVELTGTVDGPSGGPITGAFVGMGDATATTDSNGQFKLSVDRARSVPAFLWAPGAQYEKFTYDLGWLPTTAITSSLPAFHLYSVFTNAMSPANLGGLPVETGPRFLTSHIHGWSQLPLSTRVYVTMPSGWVRTYPLTSEGRSFSATLPFKQRGEYQVEILAASGLELFSVPVFHGISPSPPVGPKFPADPATTNQVHLARFTLSLINDIRQSMGLARVSMPSNLRFAAYKHSEDMARSGFYYTHPHIGSDGSTVQQRVEAAAVHFRSVAEDIGMGSTIGQTLDSLVQSPIHRMILLGHYNRVGVGLARWRGMWIMTIDLCR
jgi:uncharacterized protein YkwD